MADKLSWSELRRTLATRAGISEKDANTFLVALTGELVESLKADRQVKINGLGTFRLQAVAPRKSVNISSGEEMVIDGYNKLSFTPEIGIKELIEKSQSASQNAPIAADKSIDPLQKLGEQANEIVDILADLGQAPAKGKEETVTPNTPAKESEEELPSTPEKEKVVEDEPIIFLSNKKDKKDKKGKKEKKVKSEEIPNIPEKSEVIPNSPEKGKVANSEKPKQYHFLRDTLICVVLLLFLLLIGFFFLRNQFTEWIDTLGQTQRVEMPVQSGEVQEAQVMQTPIVPTASVQYAEAPQAEPQKVHYEQYITTEPMHEASRLAWMSMRYYGNKAYWPYLYDANKDHISNPNKIVVGTPIRVPKLTAEQMDTTLEQTRVNLQYLLEQAEKASLE